MPSATTSPTDFNNLKFGGALGISLHLSKQLHRAKRLVSLALIASIMKREFAHQQLPYGFQSLPRMLPVFYSRHLSPKAPPSRIRLAYYIIILSGQEFSGSRTHTARINRSPSLVIPKRRRKLEFLPQYHRKIARIPPSFLLQYYRNSMRVRCDFYGEMESFSSRDRVNLDTASDIL